MTELLPYTRVYHGDVPVTAIYKGPHQKWPPTAQYQGTWRYPNTSWRDVPASAIVIPADPAAWQAEMGTTVVRVGDQIQHTMVDDWVDCLCPMALAPETDFQFEVIWAPGPLGRAPATAWVYATRTFDEWMWWGTAQGYDPFPYADDTSYLPEPHVAPQTTSLRIPQAIWDEPGDPWTGFYLSGPYNTYVSGFRWRVVNGRTEPYAINDSVDYDGQRWWSTIDNNDAVPGSGTEWIRLDNQYPNGSFENATPVTWQSYVGNPVTRVAVPDASDGHYIIRVTNLPNDYAAMFYPEPNSIPVVPGPVSIRLRIRVTPGTPETGRNALLIITQFEQGAYGGIVTESFLQNPTRAWRDWVISTVVIDPAITEIRLLLNTRAAEGWVPTDGIEIDQIQVTNTPTAPEYPTLSNIFPNGSFEDPDLSYVASYNGTTIARVPVPDAAVGGYVLRLTNTPYNLAAMFYPIPVLPGSRVSVRFRARLYRWSAPGGLTFSVAQYNGGSGLDMVVGISHVSEVMTLTHEWQTWVMEGGTANNPAVNQIGIQIYPSSATWAPATNYYPNPFFETNLDNVYTVPPGITNRQEKFPPASAPEGKFVCRTKSIPNDSAVVSFHGSPVPPGSRVSIRYMARVITLVEYRGAWQHPNTAWNEVAAGDVVLPSASHEASWGINVYVEGGIIKHDPGDWVEVSWFAPLTPETDFEVEVIWAPGAPPGPPPEGSAAVYGAWRFDENMWDAEPYPAWSPNSNFPDVPHVGTDRGLLRISQAKWDSVPTIDRFYFQGAYNVWVQGFRWRVINGRGVPYRAGDIVDFDGQRWQSVIANNYAMPGTGLEWVLRTETRTHYARGDAYDAGGSTIAGGPPGLTNVGVALDLTEEWQEFVLEGGTAPANCHHVDLVLVALSTHGAWQPLDLLEVDRVQITRTATAPPYTGIEFDQVQVTLTPTAPPYPEEV